MSLPPAVLSNALQIKLLWYYSLYSESEWIYFSQYCSNGKKWNVICLVKGGGQERYQIALWYLFLAYYIYSVNVICTARFFVHYVFSILIILQLVYHLVIRYFHKLLQVSRSLSGWIFLSRQFVRSYPAVSRDMFVLIRGWHSIYNVKLNMKVMFHLCVTFLQM
jgi:hypothetical protein